MSDISIPGVTASKYKTDELIQGLMKAERIPRDRAESELKKYKQEQSAWRQLNQLTTVLRDASKTLYSYNNPFSEKIAASTNERALTATVTREAKEQSFRVLVSQIAQTDSFLSNEIDSKGTVPQGEYTFSVGDKSVTFSWKGGSYKDFSEALNRRSSGILRASFIQITPKTSSMLLESLKPGEKNRLTFSGDARNFAIEAGFITPNDTAPVSPEKEAHTAPPLSSERIDFSGNARAKDGLVLTFSVSVHPVPSGSTGENAASGLEPVKAGSVTYANITIENAHSEGAPTDAQPVLKPQPVTDMSVLSLRSSKGVQIPLPAVRDSEEPVEMSIPLSEYGDVDALLVNNKNTEKELRISGLKISDPRAAGDVIPVNPVSIAQDAVLKYEGITIRRPTNTIDDLVPGVTLQLFEPTDKNETISVKPDTDLAKEAIITLVAHYNRVMAELNILTQNKPEVISEIQYFTEDETKTAEERLGMMLGDSTLTGLKNALQRITSSGYRANDTTTITILSQLGISTRSTAGSGVDSSKLRGYLEIDEKKLDEALKTKIEDIKLLFGFDSDGDLVVDSGIAQALDKNLTPYVQTGGIFPNRTSGLGTKITASEKKIAQLDTQLERKEAELKSQYGQMEGTLNSLQNQSNSISNFSKQNSN